MNILLTRYHKTKEVIDGYLKIDGSIRLCDTAENAQHCLPAGTYRVIVAKCKFRSRKMPIILLEGEDSTPTRCTDCVKSECVTINSIPHKGGDGGGLLFCPQITPGNGAYNRNDGAILVGTHITQGCLKFPKEAFDNLYDRIRKSAERHHEITLTIIEKYPEPSFLELSPYAMGTRILKQL